jgi:hypothetical protein
VRTLDRSLPNQRHSLHAPHAPHARQVSRTHTEHDHAWQKLDDDGPLLLGKYRCDLCQVVWAL